AGGRLRRRVPGPGARTQTPVALHTVRSGRPCERGRDHRARAVARAPRGHDRAQCAVAGCGARCGGSARPRRGRKPHRGGAPVEARAPAERGVRMSGFPPSGDPIIPDYGEVSDCVTNNDFFCTDWFVQQWPSVFWPALLDHILMTVIAIVVGFAIAFTAALEIGRAHV